MTTKQKREGLFWDNLRASYITAQEVLAGIISSPRQNHNHHCTVQLKCYSDHIDTLECLFKSYFNGMSNDEIINYSTSVLSVKSEFAAIDALGIIYLLNLYRVPLTIDIRNFVQDFAISAICVTDNDPFYLKALNSIPNQYSQCKLIIKAGIR
ncbi:MAG: hypothetical protein WC942_09185, partial [Clostridia bacterium]